MISTRTHPPVDTETISTPRRWDWIWEVLLIAVLLAGAYFRLTGLNWDQGQHLHPDERFLTLVETSLQAPRNLGEYFNTAVSRFNPNNVGHTFFVYGTLPLFLVYYVGEWFNALTYDQIHLVGRAVSGIFDLGSVLLAYLISRQLFRRRGLAWLAAAFYAFAVLPIQLSHFFAVDTFLAFFVNLALYAAVLVQTRPQPRPENRPTVFTALAEEDPAEDIPLDEDESWPVWEWLRGSWQGIGLFLLFGAAYAAALASKVTALPIAALLPLAAFIWWQRLPEEGKVQQAFVLLRNLVIAGVTAFLLFRIFQPYAFNGPGFFNFGINQDWIADLRELSLYSNGDADYPPALQWARRPVTFSLKNYVLWGVGLPLGVLAWAGFLWAGWRMLRGEWRSHIVLWSWTAVFFVWQSIGFTRSMRYQIPVYVTLSIFAAWALVKLWDWGRERIAERRGFPWMRIASGLLGGFALLSALGYSYAFTRMYTQLHTRVEASYWIYQNVPGPVTLKIDTGDDVVSQPVGVDDYAILYGGRPRVYTFTAGQSGLLAEIRFDDVVELTGDELTDLGGVEDIEGLQLTVRLLDGAAPQGDLAPVSTAVLYSDFMGGPTGGATSVVFSEPLAVEAGQVVQIEVMLPEADESLIFRGGWEARYLQPEGEVTERLPDWVRIVEPDIDYQANMFSPRISGEVNAISFAHLVDWENPDEEKTLRVSLYRLPELAMPIASGELTATFAAGQDRRGQGWEVHLDQPAQVSAGSTYEVRLEIVEGDGSIAVYPTRLALETAWDDPLPNPVDGLWPFPNVYDGDLNFEMYWDDNADKLDRFVSVLDQAEYLILSSNRQWGTTVRVPERYPLTTAYYRNLMGCPADMEVFDCYADAQIGMFEGNLGYELVYVGQRMPTLGPISLNTQYAEEAFSVYDHPKVLIFKKSAGYDPEHVREVLGAVDLTRVIRLTPGEASRFKGTLTLPASRLAEQRAGGTWSEIFDMQSLVNRNQWAAGLVWYLAVALLGWTVYPLLRLTMGSLSDRGYAFARLAGMLLLAYLVWLGGSLGIPATRPTIWAAFGLLVALNAGLAYWQRDRLRQDWKENRRLILTIEALALAFFVFFLLVRLGNPDLWHPAKGGEKPMDYAYLNAVIKSTTFPPYDPWYAGGYINYYYYGFVVVGTLVEALGINPDVAYNLILPSLYSITAIGAFSVGWNLVQAGLRRRKAVDEEEPLLFGLERLPLLGGVVSAVFMLVVGNLGTVRMIWHGLQMLASDGAPIEGASLITRWIWTFKGLGYILAGAKLPYGPGSWYWDPSRAIATGAGNEITEFPFFTFLYADLHAHLMALPVTVFAVGLAVAALRWCWNGGKADRSFWPRAGQFLALAGVVVGSLRPTNTWDFPTYLALVSVALMYVTWRRGLLPGFLRPLPLARWIAPLLPAGVLVVLATILYQPFAQWYGQGYTLSNFYLWRGPWTPIASYLVHWGLFLFTLATWMFWETRDWMASTPLSALHRLRPYRWMIQAAVIVLVLATGMLMLRGIMIAWIALPMAAWAGVLILRPDQPEGKRGVLFMVGTGLVLTLAVELIAMNNDPGRMNTIFKFYMQAWTLLSLSSGAAFVWLAPQVNRVWTPSWKHAWQITAILLIFGAGMFTVMGGLGKIRDRMSSQAPHTLDGMAYMRTSMYYDFDQEMQLEQDYQAIKWLRENVAGSPVLVEANPPLYHWANRFSTYTGLPNVVGWEWHQMQQRALLPQDWVRQRVQEVHNFYQTVDREEVEAFLQKYDVGYIVVGQTERAQYPGPGLEKFDAWEGDLWEKVYSQDDTVIYRVKS